MLEPRSQEHVDLVRRNWELANQGADDEIVRTLAPDVEWHHNVGLGSPMEGVYHGREEVLALFRAIRLSFGMLRFEVEEVRELSAGEVLSLGYLHGEGRGSGAPAATPFGAVTEIRAGLAVRQRFWMSRAAAIAAAGLKEQAKSRDNVEVVRAGVALFSAKEIAGVAELYSPDAFLVAPEDWPEGGRFEGRAAVIRQYTRILEEWGSHSMRIDRECSGGDWVVLRLIWNAEGRASGAPIAMSIVGAYRVEGGKIVEGRFFWDFDEALEAVGLGRGASPAVRGET